MCTMIYASVQSCIMKEMHTQELGMQGKSEHEFVRRPGIDSKIPPAYVAWWAGGTITLFVGIDSWAP